MADRTDDLLISVSTDLSTIKRQLKQLGQDVGSTTSGIQKQFDGLGKGIDQSLSPVQKRINDMLGIANTGAKPLKEWKGALADAATGFSVVGKGAALTSNQMLNLSRQGNDVITMFALGAKPMQIFASQAGQIYGALQEGPGGVGGSLKALGTQIVGLATKFPLATAAIAAAGVALAAYALVGGTNIRSLDEILKSHEENIKRLGDAYDQVVGKQQKYAQISAGTASLVNDKDLADAKAKLQAAINDIFSSASTQSGVGRGGGTREFIKAAFAPFQEAIDNLKNSAKDTTDLRAFTDAVTAIASANPDLKGPAQQLLDFSKGALDAASAVETMGGVFPDAIDTVSEFQRALASVDSKPVQKELQALFDKARDGTASIDDIRAALTQLDDANPTFAGIITSIGNIIIAAHNAAAAVNNINLGGTRTKDDNAFPPTIKLPDTAPTPDGAPNREDQGAYEDALAKRRARSSSRAPKKTADDRFAEDLQAIRDRTAALNEEYNALGLSFQAQTQRKTALDLEQTALKQVREEARKKGDVDWQNAQLSPAQVAAINAVSEAYAKQADELRKAQEMQALQRDILQGVFDDLRSALEDGKLDWQDFGKIAEDVLDKIIDKIETDLIDAILQASNAGGGSGGILGSILGLFTGGGGGSSFGTPGGFAQMLGIPGYATGTDNHPGGLAVVGERGPELLNLPRGAQVIPRVPSISPNGGGGGSAVYQDNRTISIDAKGAQQGVGEEIKRALAEYDKSSIPRTLSALRTAKTRGMV